jgi:tetratricopeptide (TPR) repeat protein
MNTQRRFLIAPSDRIAAALAADQATVSIVNDRGIAEEISVDRFVRVYRDFSVVSLANVEEAQRELERRVENSNCLDMVLFLFDAELPVELRREVAAELELLLEESDNQQYALDLILSRPLPKSADVQGARTVSEGTSRTRGLVLLICRSQERVKAIYHAWLALRHEPLLRGIAESDLLGCLIRRGVFRRLVDKATDRRSLNALLGSVVLDDELTRRFPIAPRILTKWFGLIGETLPAELAHGLAMEDPVERIDAYPGPRRRAGRRAPADAARDAAVSQVGLIVDHFAKGRDQQASGILEQALSSNLADYRGERHAVKTLCNVASKAAARGRKDISTECLARALRYPRGCDAVLYSQIGNEYRDLGRLNEAMQCYEKAEDLASDRDYESLEVIRNSKIHVLTVTGRYDEALASYRAIPDFGQKPSVLCAMGDLLRKTGQLVEARRYYDICRGIAPEADRAVAGLAEVLKQKGKFHEAIRAYNGLLRDFDIPDEKSLLVYQLAQSRLLRFVGQYEKAKRILLDLHADSPRHSDINLQLAILYKILGDLRNSALHRDLARTSESDRVRLSILEGLAPCVPTAADSAGDYHIGAGILPEDIGLAECARAVFDEIASSRHVEVVTRLSSVRFVDRILENLADVLKFHALASSRLAVFPELQRAIHLLAKRGHRSLRDAISAIRREDFLAAKRCEAAILLQAA